MDDEGKFERFSLHLDAEEAKAVASLESEIYGYLRCVEHYHKSSVEARFRPEGMHERDFWLVVHTATQRLLFEGITFAPVKGSSQGMFHRADSRQAEGRARAMSKAAALKSKRAVQLHRNAAATCEDPEEKARLEALALRHANEAIAAKTAARLALRPRPKGL